MQSRDQLIRRLKLRNYFGDRDQKNEKNFRKNFIEKSTFIPPEYKLDGNVLNLIEEISNTTNAIIKNNKKILFNTNSANNNNKATAIQSVKDSDDNAIIKLREPNNLSPGEYKTIQELRNNKTIIIKPADKGGATVIMNKQDYLQEAYRQLNNNKYYVKLDEPIYHNNVKIIRSILEEMQTENFITKQQLSYLSGPVDYNARTFYLLPKIHKKREKWPLPNIPECRPIVSDVQSETYRVSEFIDYFINPLTTEHQTYIKNSFEFVKKLQNFKIEPNWLLVTGDISALYTNMHFDRTIECVKKAFNEHPDPNRPDKGLIKLLEISLKNNDFNFNGEYFLQVLGTAMGKRFAPGLANLYLLELDDQAINNFPIHPILFIRYLDDIFFIWPDSEETLKNFENFLNNLIPDIKINFEFSKNEISFLDVLIYTNNGTLHTKTFFKETDTHQLLHTNSFHPKHTFNGLIKSQLIRFKRLSSTQQNYNDTCKTLFGFLKNRGYNQSKLRKLQHNIWYNYVEPDKETKKIKSNMIPIIVDYCSVGKKLASEFKNLLKNNKFTKEIKFITAYKNGKNLKQMLVKSKLENNNIGAFHGCSQVRCQTCKSYAPPTKSCKIYSTSETINVKNKIYCDSRNILYLITCQKCHKQYIGETGRTLRDRLNDHKSAIKNRSKTPISIHFNDQNHSVLDLKITPIEIIENHLSRIQKEKELQIKFKTLFPSGINNTPIN